MPRHRTRWSDHVTPAVRNIILACTGVFLVQVVLNLFAPVASRLLIRELGLVPVLVTRGLRL